MLSRFGTRVNNIFTNQGIKFCGEFQKLCEKTLIDHFKVNKLVEWMV